MKKTIMVLVVACVLVSSLFASFSFRSLGVDTGFGRHGGLFVSADMEVAKDLDVYARLGLGSTRDFNVSAGVQYRVAYLDIAKAKVPFKPGLQLDFNFGNAFYFEALLTAEFSFDARPFTAFVRPGFGLGTSKGRTIFNWGVETGVAYLF